MKINKFLIAGAAVAALSFSAHAQEAPTNQQEINPTVAKTLNTVGGFFGALAQGAKGVIDTTANGVKTIANSEGAQNIKSGVVKGAKVVSNTASDIANSEAGQAVKDTAVKGAKFVSNTASDVAHSEAGQAVKDTTVKGAKIIAGAASDVANSEAGQAVKDTTVKGAKFVASTATDGARAVSKGYTEVSNTTEPTVEAASVAPVNQATTTPSLSEGVEAAKNKIGSMISFLRDKATTKENTNEVEGSKVKP